MKYILKPNQNHNRLEPTTSSRLVPSKTIRRCYKTSLDRIEPDYCTQTIWKESNMWKGTKNCPTFPSFNKKQASSQNRLKGTKLTLAKQNSILTDKLKKCNLINIFQLTRVKQQHNSTSNIPIRECTFHPIVNVTVRCPKTSFPSVFLSRYELSLTSINLHLDFQFGS